MNLHWNKDELEEEITKALVASWDCEDVLATKHGSNLDPLSAPDFSLLKQRGIYFAPEDRIGLAGRLDMANDYVPAWGCVGFGTPDPGIYYRVAAFRGLQRLPGGVMPRALGKPLVLDYFDFRIAGGFFGGRFYATIAKNGEITPATTKHDTRLFDDEEGKRFWWAAPAAITLWCDRRYLWNVSVHDPSGSKAHFGVYEEEVISLFRSREEPITATGRLRPMLHWVRTHQRRLRSGDVAEIPKHLRGIDGFEMDGFGFEITQPRKKAARPATAAA